MKKIKQIIKKMVTKEVLLYITFGILTTVVNIGTLYILTKAVHLEENIANIIAILLAVIFAYLTNKDMVFHSNAKTVKEKVIQFAKFMEGRAFTMLIEWGGCAILFLTPIPQMVSKLFMTVIVILLNFFISKFFAFRKINRG